MTSTNWLNKFKSNVKDSSVPTKLSSKKKFWLGAAILLGISLIFLGSGGKEPPSPPAGKKAADIGEPGDSSSAKSVIAGEEKELSARLQSMLEKIEGAGNVRVTVRLAASTRESYAINTTTGKKNTVEKDQGGGTRTITENTGTSQLVMARNGQGDSPVVEMETASQVAGVLVVADGAADPRVRERLFDAVRVALNVEAHRIMVLPGNPTTYNQ